MNIPNDVNVLSKELVDCFYVVHKDLGPGFLERVYELALIQELKDRNIKFEVQKSIPLYFKGKSLGISHTLDLLVEEKVVVELKSTENMVKLYEAQIISYLKATNCRLGFLVNFNRPLIKDGIKRIVL